MLTGRAVYLKKNIVENVRKLDILALQRAKVFNQGPERKCNMTWHHGDEVRYSIEFSLIYSGERLDSIWLDYTITDQHNGNTEFIYYHIKVTSTPCHYGGKRWWFICPINKNGRKCIRRCRILYLPTDATLFGCRECYSLSYKSRQQHRSNVHEMAVQSKFIDSALARLKKCV